MQKLIALFMLLMFSSCQTVTEVEIPIKWVKDHGAEVVETIVKADANNDNVLKGAELFSILNRIIDLWLQRKQE